MSLTKYAEFAVLAVESAHGEVLSAKGENPFVKQAHRHEFEYERRPGYIYVRSRAISSRCNDNFDEFPAEEIKQAYRTFIGKPVFVNHHNANHRRARGVIIDAALHEDTNPDGSPDTWAEVLMEVDAVRFPRLAEAVIAGDVARTSMGTDVAYSVCTACGNKAQTPVEYCQHIPKMKGMKIRRVTASGQTEEVLVAERCFGLGFFENSLLVEPPADPTAFVLGVDGAGLSVAAAKAIIEEQPVSMAKSAAATIEKGTPEYKGHYNRGWASGTRGSGLDAADVRGEPNAWYDGYMDAAVGRPKWSLMHHDSAEAANEALDNGWTPPGRGKQASIEALLAEADTLLTEAYFSHRDVADMMNGNKPHGEQVRHPRTAPAGPMPGSHDIYHATPADKAKPGYGLGSEQRIHDGQDAYDRDVERQHRQLQREWTKSHPGQQFPYRASLHTQAGLDMGDMGYVDGYLGRPKHHGEDPDYALRYNIGERDRIFGDMHGVGPTLRSLVEQNATPAEWAKVPQRSFPPEQPKQHWWQRGSSLHAAALDMEDQGYVDGYLRRHEQHSEDPDYAQMFDIGTQDRVQSELFGYGPVLDELIDANATPAEKASLPKPKAPEEAKKKHWWQRRSMLVEAYGETKAPAQVDTLRADRCPVCKDDEAFNGEKCSVCGHVVPPPQFRDPDLTKAQEVDLRQDQQDAMDADPGAEVPGADGSIPTDGDGGEDLTCTNCGEVFSAEGEPEASADPGVEAPQEPRPEPAADDQAPDAVDPAADPEPDDLSDLADLDEDDLDLDEAEEAAVDEPDEQPGTVKVDEPQDPTADPATTPEEQPDQPDDLSDLTVAPNQTCPVCGEGTLVPTAADSPEQPESEVPPVGADMTEQQTAGQPNPAKVARNRIIAALQGQQAIITRLAHDNEVLKTALRDVVTGAGLQNLPRFASLMATAADTNNNPDGAPATTTEEAKKPDATDSVENVGGTPGANGNVTPAAVTDVQNSNVAADAPVLDNLQDVTAPVGGTDAPTPAAATGEGEITSKAPSNDVMDPAGSTGWTTSSRGDDQSRFVASLRLARLQISAGVAAGEDLTVAQAIFDGTDSLDVIAAQASTLSAVASKQASAQPGQQHRHLVPQPSRPGVRAASLQSPIQPTAAVSGGRGEDEFMFGLSVD